MINFLRIQYQIGRISIQQLNDLVDQGRITQEEYNFITG